MFRSGDLRRPLRTVLNHLTLNKKYAILLAVGLLWVIVALFYYSSYSVNGSSEYLEETVDLSRALAPKFNVAKRIAYVSRHIGTTTDFKYMAEHLQLENVDYYDSSKYFSFGASKEEYSTIIVDGTVKEICSTHDAVFISDSLADGWPFIMDGKQPCKNVVFVATNRFDYGVKQEDREAFYRDFNYSLNRDDEYRGRVTANNKFEIPYIESKGVDIPDFHPIIRPFGFNSVKAQDIDPADTDLPCLIIGRVPQDEELMNNLVAEKTNHKCKVVPKHYGGPKTLSKYRSIVVHLPYQVSIMKMWENLAYGVLMLVPSPDFFTKICTDNYCAQADDAMETKKIIGLEHWSEYLDFYLPGWEGCFIQYSSWKELDNILETKEYLKNVNTCRDKMEDLRELNLQSWKKLLKVLD